MDVEQHIARIRKSRYHDYTRSREITLELEDLLTFPKRPRMPNRLIIGPSNNGKTMLIRRLLLRHSRADNKEGDKARVPIVLVEVDGPNENQLYTSILKYLRSPFPATARTDAKKDQVLHQLNFLGVKMLIIDEFHNLLAGADKKQSHFRNIIKLFGNVLELPIVAVGTELAYNALQVDEQLANRFCTLELPRWTAGEQYGRLLLAIKTSWDVEFDVDTLGDEVLARTNKTIGAVTDLLEYAAVWSLRNRGTARIDEEALAKYPYRR